MDTAKTADVRRVMEREFIEAANAIAVERGYNRTLPEAFIANLDARDLFPVTYWFAHEHAAGVPVEAHVRAVFVWTREGATATLDIDAALWCQMATVPKKTVSVVDHAYAMRISQKAARRVVADRASRTNVADPDAYEDDARIIEVERWLCAECGALSEETLGEAVYECGTCGTEFPRSGSYDGDSARCPDCGKFSSKLRDDACVDCEVGEVEWITAYECAVCHEVYELPDDVEDCLRSHDRAE